MRIKLDIREVWEMVSSNPTLTEEEAMVGKALEKVRSWETRSGNVDLQARVMRSTMEYYHDSSEEGLKWCLESALNDWALISEN
jgi:hypothetical protein